MNIVIIGKNSLIVEGIQKCLKNQKINSLIVTPNIFCYKKKLIDFSNIAKYRIIIYILSEVNCENITLLKKIRHNYPEQKILLIVNSLITSFHVLRNLGIQGIILDTACESQFVNAIKTIFKEGIYISKEAKNNLIGNIMFDPMQINNNNGKNNLTQLLTNREKEILKYLAEGFITKEISEKLNICKDTVNFHRKNILGKLNVYGVKNTASLIKFAFENYLI